MTEKAAAVGFDWQRPPDVLAKLREEVAELEAEISSDDPRSVARARGEMGDVLFVLANLARHLGVEPETALQETNSKFLTRFQAIEARVAAQGRSLRDLELDELDPLWDEVKAGE